MASREGWPERLTPMQTQGAGNIQTTRNANSNVDREDMIRPSGRRTSSNGCTNTNSRAKTTHKPHPFLTNSVPRFPDNLPKLLQHDMTNSVRAQP